MKRYGALIKNRVKADAETLVDYNRRKGGRRVVCSQKRKCYKKLWEDVSAPIEI